MILVPRVVAVIFSQKHMRSKKLGPRLFAEFCAKVAVFAHVVMVFFVLISETFRRTGLFAWATLEVCVIL